MVDVAVGSCIRQGGLGKPLLKIFCAEVWTSDPSAYLREEHSKPVLCARIMFPLYSRTARRQFSWRRAGKVKHAGG